MTRTSDQPILGRVVQIWLLACALMLATNLGGIIAGRFPDPDDVLRLVQVRDLIAGQGWFDLTQHRIDASHGGVPMHWSRLVDLPVAGLILILTPLLGSALAEQAAIVAVPLLTLGVTMWLAARLAKRLLGDQAVAFTCLAMAMAVPVVAQMRPLRIDHHGWQVVAALAAALALLGERARRGGWIAGTALAVWLAISLEGLPMTAALAGIAALRWLRDPADRAWLVGLSQGLAGSSALLFAATRGTGDLAPHCDAITPVHLAALGWAALVLTGLGALRAQSLGRTLAGLALAGAGALGILLMVAPGCASGTFNMLDPVVRHFWYNNVSEGLPLWKQDLATALQTAIPAGIGLWAALRLIARKSGQDRARWIDFCLMLGAALALALFVNRAGAVAGALATLPLGWQLERWLASVREPRGARRTALTLTAMVLALLPTFPLTVLGMIRPAAAGSAALGAPMPHASSCAIARASSALHGLPRGTVLAPLDIGPQLLLDSPLDVVATGHHRGATAMRAVIDAFTGDDATARRVVARYGADYVMLCPDLAEPADYAHAAPNGLAAALLAGRKPVWLEPVAMPAEVDLKVWRVSR